MEPQLPDFSGPVDFEDVETEDVIYDGEPLTDQRVESIVARLRARNLLSTSWERRD